jgi:hypothetical protein
VHKGYPVAYPERFCPGGRLLTEQQAHVHAGADDLMIARPATEHLAGAAAEVRMAVPGAIRSARPSVAYFSGVKGYEYGVRFH